MPFGEEAEPHTFGMTFIIYWKQVGAHLCLPSYPYFSKQCMASLWKKQFSTRPRAYCTNDTNAIHIHMCDIHPGNFSIDGYVCIIMKSLDIEDDTL